MTIAFKPLFESSTAGIPPVSNTITDFKQNNKTFNTAASASGDTIVYTVPTGKILFITYYSFVFSNLSGSTRVSAAYAGQVILHYISNATSVPYFAEAALNYPIPVFAGESIRINHSGTNEQTTLTLSCIELDA